MTDETTKQELSEILGYCLGIGFMCNYFWPRKKVIGIYTSGKSTTMIQIYRQETPTKYRIIISGEQKVNLRIEDDEGLYRFIDEAAKEYIEYESIEK